MTRPILICSKGRPRGKVFGLLSEAGLKWTVFVEPEEVVAYRDAWPLGQTVVSIEAAGKGIGYARRFALDWAVDRGEKRAWMMDDDIARFVTAKAGKATPAPVKQALLEAELTMRPGVGLVGLEYQQFCWSSKGGTPTGYCDVCVLIDVESAARAGVRYDPALRLKEDRDFVAQWISKGYRPHRASWVGFVCPATASLAGGCSADYQRETEVCQQVHAKWPVCTEVVQKPTGRPDVKWYWKRVPRTPWDSNIYKSEISYRTR